ncbi:hypothetical protein V1477_002180 [Vespula maculifrons]|uniref:Uncharacterized protein n=1 Tax=Vespula maculifrons TaxID=7453 RepID=A0ABD2CVW3_VESMC
MRITEGMNVYFNDDVTFTETHTYVSKTSTDKINWKSHLQSQFLIERNLYIGLGLLCLLIFLYFGRRPLSKYYLPRYRKLIEEHDFSKNSCGALELIVLAISEMMNSKTQRFSWFEFERCILIDFLMSLELSAKTIMGLEKGN